MATIDLNNPINNLTAQIVNIGYYIHSNLGPGLFESVYEDVFCYELNRSNLVFERQKSIQVIWQGETIARPAFKADIIVEKKVLIELKSVDSLAQVHYKQVETYLRLTGIKVGLLLNFNEVLFKNGIHRIVNRI